LDDAAHSPVAATNQLDDAAHTTPVATTEAPNPIKPGAPDAPISAPNHLSHLPDGDRKSVEIAEKTLGRRLDKPEDAKLVNAIVKAHNHGEGKLFDRAAVEAMDATQMKEAFGRRYPNLEGDELRTRILSQSDGANGKIGSYTDSELREKIRIVQKE
jgi:hypothetical protein